MDTWAKNPVLKEIAKAPVTSAWGKHAESVDHPKTAVFGQSESGGLDFFNDVQYNQMTVQKFTTVGENTIVFNYKENRKNQRPDLHKGYMPVACFVTAYGRLKLWDQLNFLGKRVLMYDTDSIVYTGGGPNLPIGKCLGDWEQEDFERDHGIVKFVAIGPKSYCITGRDGVEKMKLKGACIKQSHGNMINADVMKKMVNEPGYVLTLPQMTFDYRMSEHMSTRRYLKKIQFHPSDVKGDYRPLEKRAYPYGFVE